MFYLCKRIVRTPAIILESQYTLKLFGTNWFIGFEFAEENNLSQGRRKIHFIYSALTNLLNEEDKSLFSNSIYCSLPIFTLTLLTSVLY